MLTTEERRQFRDWAEMHGDWKLRECLTEIDRQAAEIEERKALLAFANKEIKRLRGLVNLLADKAALYTGGTAPGEIRWAEGEARQEQLESLRPKVVDTTGAGE